MAAAASAKMRRSQAVDLGFRWFCGLCTWGGVAVLFVLIAKILHDGLPHLSADFLNNFPSRRAGQAGLKAALWGSIWLMAATALISVPIGVCAAVYLEEYGKQNRLGNFLETNISNLAGVPSIVYGILGLAIFVRWFRLGESLLAGALTLSLLSLPVIIVAAREAIRAVPPGYRSASFALGATKWQTTWRVVLPSALPGVLTGVILALSRAMGETAPLILVGAASYIASTPRQPMDPYTALPIQIYDWASRPQKDFQDLAAAGIIVLLAVLLVLNGAAIWSRARFQARVKR